MKKKPHFKALLTFLPEDNGGISTPVSSGFRTTVRFPFDSKEFLANHTFIETDIIYSGGTVTANINLLEAKDALEQIYEGIDFDLLLNSTIIGQGVITKIYAS